MPRFRLLVLFLVVVAVQFGNCTDCKAAALSSTTSPSIFELIAKSYLKANSAISGKDDYKKISKRSISEILDPVASKLRVIFPGTLWCGAGNIAKDDKDLGYFNDTDACCRKHDHCPNNLPAGETKVNIKNDGLFTKSACTCDSEFYNCLKKVNSLISNTIGKTYFNILKPQCFKCVCPTPDCNPNDGTECKDHCNKYEWVKSKTY